MSIKQVEKAFAIGVTVGRRKMREQIERLIADLKPTTILKGHEDGIVLGIIEVTNLIIYRLEAILASNPAENGSQGLELSAIGISEVKQ